MYLISAFQQSMDAELAVVELERLGIGKERILAVPLDRLQGSRSLFDTIDRSDGISLFDLGAVLGTVFAVLGASFGFKWAWGPVIWGLIGLAFGFACGFALDIWLNRRFWRRKRASRPAADLIVMVRCTGGEQADVRTIMERYSAIGIGKVERP